MITSFLFSMYQDFLVSCLPFTLCILGYLSPLVFPNIVIIVPFSSPPEDFAPAGSLYILAPFPFVITYFVKGARTTGAEVALFVLTSGIYIP